MDISLDVFVLDVFLVVFNASPEGVDIVEVFKAFLVLDGVAVELCDSFPDQNALGGDFLIIYGDIRFALIDLVFS